MMQKITNLSKSRFVMGCQCLKRLYLSCHHRELIPPTDPATQAIFDQGHQVGVLAQQRFAGGVLVDEDHRDHPKAVIHTQKLMEDPKVSSIYEAAFAYENIWIRVDVLERQRDHWRLIEVKSTTEIKDYFLTDVAIQHYVLTKCGVRTKGPCLMHLNRAYRYDGNSYDLEKLFLLKIVEDEIQPIVHDVPPRIKKQWEILSGNQIPDIQPGPMCREPYECEFYAYCNPPISEHHVSCLPRLSPTKLDLLNKMNVSLIQDIPDDFPLTEKQQRICQCVKKGTPFLSKDLSQALNQPNYPIYFMDFESSMPAVPRYKGMRPYDQLVFQWSVHVQRNPDGKVEHYEYLAEGNGDPREKFIQSLLGVLRKKGSIVVYNKTFEQTRLTELGEWFPIYKGENEAVKKRIWDLLEVVRDHVYHPDFGGSFSLKAVLPALIPEMTYKGMDVAEGTQASLTYEAIASGSLPKDEVKRLRKALLEYCKQDTLAMVRLLDRLRQQCHSNG